MPAAALMPHSPPCPWAGPAPPLGPLPGARPALLKGLAAQAQGPAEAPAAPPTLRKAQTRLFPHKTQSHSLGGGGDSKHPRLPAPLLGERLCLAVSHSQFHQIQGERPSVEHPAPDKNLSLSPGTRRLCEGPDRGLLSPSVPGTGLSSHGFVLTTRISRRPWEASTCLPLPLDCPASIISDQRGETPPTV